MFSNQWPEGGQCWWATQIQVVSSHCIMTIPDLASVENLPRTRQEVSTVWDKPGLTSMKWSTLSALSPSPGIIPGQKIHQSVREGCLNYWMTGLTDWTLPWLLWPEIDLKKRLSHGCPLNGCYNLPKLCPRNPKPLKLIDPLLCWEWVLNLPRYIVVILSIDSWPASTVRLISRAAY